MPFVTKSGKHSNDRSNAASLEDRPSSAVFPTDEPSTCCGHGPQRAANLDSPTNQLVEIKNAVDGVAASIADHTALESALADTADEHRALKERFYELEILKPILLTLAANIDRREDEIQRLRRMWRKHARWGHLQLAAELRKLINLARSDISDLQTMIAVHGGERFENPSERFVPEIQECVKTVHSNDPAQDGMIARRSWPGYRRNGRILRAEGVFVYAYVDSARDNSKGAQSCQGLISDSM